MDITTGGKFRLLTWTLPVRSSSRRGEGKGVVIALFFTVKLLNGPGSL